MKRRFLAAVLALAVTTACFTACGEENKQENDKAETTTTTASSITSTETEKQIETTTKSETTTTSETTTEATTSEEPTKKTTSISSQNTTKASDEGIKGKTESWGEYREVFIPSGWTGLGKHENDPHSCFVSKGDVTIYITTLRIDEFIREYSFKYKCSIYDYQTTRYDSGGIEWKGHILGDRGFAIEAEIDGKKVSAYSGTLGLQNADKDLASILNSIKMK